MTVYDNPRNLELPTRTLVPGSLYFGTFEQAASYPYRGGRLVLERRFYGRVVYTLR